MALLFEQFAAGDIPLLLMEHGHDFAEQPIFGPQHFVFPLALDAAGSRPGVAVADVQFTHNFSDILCVFQFVHQDGQAHAQVEVRALAAIDGRIRDYDCRLSFGIL